MTVWKLCIIVLWTSVYSAPLPPTDGTEDSFWFGTQDLECLAMMGNSLPKVRRSVDNNAPAAPQRQTLEYVHRLFYFRGRVYEWGVALDGSMGDGPRFPQCEVTWEPAPAGSSTCSPDLLVAFTRDYRRRYGGYNLILNNCHHFANRAAKVLTSQRCGERKTKWKVMSDQIWKVIRGVFRKE